MIIRVRSYAEAESKGIKPVDSIVSSSPIYFVKKKTPPYKVVGWTRGFTFKEGEVTFPQKRKQFIAVNNDLEAEMEDLEITAINKNIAKQIAKDEIGKKFVMFERKLKKVI